MRRIISAIIVAVMVLSGMTVKVHAENDAQIRGLDFSYYQVVTTEWNKTFKNYKDEDVNVFEFVKSRGINTISVKVAVDHTKATDDARYFSLDNAITTVKAAKQEGLNTNIVLMYSDSITYKGVQTVPDGWSDPENDAKTYTTNVLTELEDNEALPTMITIGNEVNWNFLGFTGDNSWSGMKLMADLSNTIKNKGIKVGLSFSMPDDPEGIQWYFSTYLDQDWYSGQYDVVGVNVYDSESLTENITKARNAFKTNAANTDAQFIVSSVSFPYIDDDKFDVNVNTQKKKLEDVIAATISDSNAGGVIYNKAAYCGNYESLFGQDNNTAYPTPALEAFASAAGLDENTDYSTGYAAMFGLDPKLKDKDVTFKQIDGMNDNTINGVDISSYLSLKEAGVKFYNETGEEESLLKVLSDHGINYVRLRIWNDPYTTEEQTTEKMPYGGGICSTERMLEIAKEATNYDMKILLCFHYSDFWTDPGMQKLPKAWEADIDDPDKIADNVYNFTKDTVKTFVDAGVNVGMVQIGNEITRGFLGKYYSTNEKEKAWLTGDNADGFCKALNAGSKAVREEAPEALVALHLESLDATYYRKVMQVWKDHNVDYDVFGATCYPFWWANMTKLADVQNVAKDFGKMFAVMETAWPNNLYDGDGMNNRLSVDNLDTSTYSADVQGQVDVLTDVYETVLSIDNGLGAFYWEPAWIPVKPGWVHWQYNKNISKSLGTGWAGEGAKYYSIRSKMYNGDKELWGASTWENMGLFDYLGHPLKSINFYNESKKEDKYSTIMIDLVEEDGTEIGSTQIVKVKVGDTKTITLPKIDGYTLDNYEYTVTGEKEGISKDKVTYTSIFKVTLSGNKYVYNGKVKKPSVTVYYAGKKVADKIKTSNEYVTITYSKGCTNVGTYNVKVVGKGNITGTVKKSFKIIPRSTSFTKLTTKKRRVTLKWRKVSKQIKGYQIQYSIDKTFKTYKNVKISKYKTISTVIKSLKRKKRYYFRIRTYKGSYRSNWSKVRNIVVK